MSTPLIILVSELYNTVLIISGLSTGTVLQWSERQLALL